MPETNILHTEVLITFFRWAVEVQSVRIRRFIPDDCIGMYCTSVICQQPYSTLLTFPISLHKVLNQNCGYHDLRMQLETGLNDDDGLRYDKV